LNTISTKYTSYKKKPGKTKAFFICLLIASFLWLIHSLNTVYTYTFKVPVVFKNLPQNKKPLIQIPENLYVDAKASGLKLLMILLSEPYKQVEIDFNTLKSVNKNQNYILSSSHINFTGSFKFETQIKHISPDTLYFSTKTGYQKIVPVKVPMHLKCLEGYAHQKPVINPAFITIWGDTALIQAVDTIYTQPLTLNNMAQSVNTNLEFIKPSENVYSTLNETNVFIEVGKLIEQTLTVPVSNIYRSSLQVNIFPAKVKVKFTSLQNSFNAGDTSLFKATINSSRINKVTKKCPVSLSTVPGNVNIMGIEPNEVEILILKK